MSNVNHTPAPWRASNGFIYAGQQMLFAAPTVEESRVGVSVHPESKEHLANSTLAAAAPELLEAGELMLAFYDDLAKSNPGFMGKLCLQDYSRWNEALLKLPAAISKTKGLTPNTAKTAKESNGR